MSYDQMWGWIFAIFVMIQPFDLVTGHDLSHYEWPNVNTEPNLTLYLSNPGFILTGNFRYFTE